MVHVFRQAALTTVLLSFSTMNPVSVPSRGHLSRLPTTLRWLHSRSPPDQPLLASHVYSLQGGQEEKGEFSPLSFSLRNCDWSGHSPSLLIRLLKTLKHSTPVHPHWRCFNTPPPSMHHASLHQRHTHRSPHTHTRSAALLIRYHLCCIPTTSYQKISSIPQSIAKFVPRCK